jgi:hypothetical protein
MLPGSRNDKPEQRCSDHAAVGDAELVQVALPLFKLRPAGARKGQMVLRAGSTERRQSHLRAPCEA